MVPDCDAELVAALLRRAAEAPPADGQDIEIAAGGTVGLAAVIMPPGLGDLCDRQGVGQRAEEEVLTGWLVSPVFGGLVRGASRPCPPQAGPGLGLDCRAWRSPGWRASTDRRGPPGGIQRERMLSVTIARS
jgi:hypothetical protein